ERAIEVRAFFDRALAVIFGHAAPEHRLAFVVDTYQFEPGVVGIDGAAGEEMADALGSHHDIDTDGVAAADGGMHAVKRSSDRRGGGSSSLRVGAGPGRDFGFRFFSHCEGSCEFVLRDCSWL